MAVDELPVGLGVERARCPAVQFLAVDSFGHQQAVEAHGAGAGDVGVHSVADGQHAVEIERIFARALQKPEGHAVDRRVGLAGLLDFAAQNLVAFGQGAGAIDQLVAAIDDKVGIGADHRQVFRPQGDEDIFIIGRRLDRVLDEAGADGEIGFLQGDRRYSPARNGGSGVKQRPVALGADMARLGGRAQDDRRAQTSPEVAMAS